MKNNLILVGLILSLISCEKANNDCYEPYDQIVLFESEYINFAWGYDHQGWLLDMEGNVHFYRLPENWKKTNDKHLISEDSLISNLRNCDTIIYHVDQKELDKYTCFINDLANGEITELIHKAYDAGAQMYICYTYNKNDKTYKRILIKQYGDFESENLSDKAESVNKWLYKIDTIVRKRYYQ